MQTHYCFISSLYLSQEVSTPFKYKNQFVLYDNQISKFSRKREVEKFLRNHYSTLGYSHVLINRTKKPYQLAGDIVIPSRNNVRRFLQILRVIKPNNSFLKFEAFHTGQQFQSSSSHDDIPHFLSRTKDSIITSTDIKLLNKCIYKIRRLKPQQQHRINNFYGYLEQSIIGTINYRIIWIFIALESLFHLKNEHRNYTPNMCKRTAYFLEPNNRSLRKKVYDILYSASKLRGTLVHGGMVDDQEVKDLIIKLEPIVWNIGRKLLISNKKWLKQFSSFDEDLSKYFIRIDKKSINL